MQNARTESAAERFGLSLVYWGEEDEAALAPALREAARILEGLALDYEIIVPGPAADSGRRCAVDAENIHNTRVRYVAAHDALTYSSALRLAAMQARLSHVALIAGAEDLASLPELVGLARNQPILCVTASLPGDPLPRQALAWLYNLTARLLLHVPIRECRPSATASVLQRSVLADILPESEGAFAQAELLARAKQRGLTAAQVVSHGHAHSSGRRAEHSAALAGGLLAMLRFWWCRIQFPATPDAKTTTRTAAMLGAILALLAALVFYSDLNHPLLDPDEGRQAEIPREMLEHRDLLVPRMLGDPYYDKPPLQYWLTAGAYAVLGVRPWVARLIPATAAWATVMLSFLWGRRALGERAGFLGAAGLCLTAGFVLLGRTVVLDSLLTACVVASWAAAYVAVAHGPLRRGWWAASALACGLGILAKGPVAVVLVVPPVLACQCLVPAFARPRLLAWAAFAGLALVVAGPWYTAIAIQEPNYLQEFVWKNHVLRYLQAYTHPQPWWFYLPVLIGLTFPWSFLWPALAYFLGTRTPGVARLRTRGLGFAMLSLIWWVLFYSLSGSKSPPYMGPAMVPLALLLGACLDARLQQQGQSGRFIWDGFTQWWPRWVTLVMLLAVAGCALATWLLNWQSWPWALAEALGSLLLLLVWWRLGRKAGPGLAWTACAAATLAFNLFAVQDLVAGVAGRHSPAGIARKIRRWKREREPIIWMYGRQLPSASFYLRRDGGALFCPRDNLYTLIAFMQTAPETLVMVETGPLLDELVHNIPPTLETEVVVPDREGQVALVVVRERAAPAGTAVHE